MRVANENRNTRKGKPEQVLTVLRDYNHVVDEERKYEVLGQLRLKLGKTKEEFNKIFELYNHLLNQKVR